MQPGSFWEVYVKRQEKKFPFWSSPLDAGILSYACLSKCVTINTQKIASSFQKLASPGLYYVLPFGSSGKIIRRLLLDIQTLHISRDSFLIYVPVFRGSCSGTLIQLQIGHTIHRFRGIIKMFFLMEFCSKRFSIASLTFLLKEISSTTCASLPHPSICSYLYLPKVRYHPCRSW